MAQNIIKFSYTAQTCKSRSALSVAKRSFKLCVYFMYVLLEFTSSCKKKCKKALK